MGDDIALPVLGALYYFWLWFKQGTLKPPGRYRIGLRRQNVDLNLWQAAVGPRVGWVARVVRITALPR